MEDVFQFKIKKRLMWLCATVEQTALRIRELPGLDGIFTEYFREGI